MSVQVRIGYVNIEFFTQGGWGMTSNDVHAAAHAMRQLEDSHMFEDIFWNKVEMEMRVEAGKGVTYINARRYMTGGVLEEICVSDNGQTLIMARCPEGVFDDDQVDDTPDWSNPDGTPLDMFQMIKRIRKEFTWGEWFRRTAPYIGEEAAKNLRPL